jgi:hypothetical protein
MDEMLPIAAGGGLALLALGGTAAALIGRRRRRKEQEWADAQTMAFEPFETAAAPKPERRPEPAIHQGRPAMAEPSAFAWGNRTQAEAKAPAVEPDGRRPGETWVEAAYRGPTPSNPSASLRHRLKRAAFFDKREREAAAGLSRPVDANAGLPETMVEEQERELA